MTEPGVRRLDFLFPICPQPRNKRVLPNHILIIAALLPLLYAVILSGYILSKGTPGFGIEITQKGFLVSDIDSTNNQIARGDTIVSISGIPHYRILGSVFEGRHLPGQQMETLTLLNNGTPKTINYHTDPIDFKYFLQRTWASFIFIFATAFLMISAVLKSSDEQPADLMLLTYSLFSTIIITDFPSRLGILDPSLISASFLVVVISHWLAFSSWTHFVFQFPAERQILTERPLATISIYLLPPLIAIIASIADSRGSAMFYSSLQHYKYWATPLLILGTFLKHVVDYFNLDNSIAKQQLKLFMSGISIGIAPYIFLYLAPHIFIDQPLITFNTVIISALLIPLAISVAMIKYNLMDVDQLISKGLAYAVLIYSFIALYSLSIVFLEQTFHGRGGFSKEFSAVFILLIALVFNPLKNRIQSGIGKLFLRDPINYDIVLYQFSRKIMKSLHLTGLLDLLLDALPEKFRIENTSVMISYDDRIRCYPKHTSIDLNPDRQKALFHFTEGINTYFYTEEKTSFSCHNADAVEVMASMKSKLVFKLKGSQQFQGVLLLGDKKNKRLFTRAELRTFSTLANYISIAIENALMYESIKASRDQIQLMFNKVTQAEKLAAIGEMTAVLTHEIRNPLAIIRSSAEFLKNRLRDPHIQEELLSNIVDEIDMLNIVVDNTLGMARYTPPALRKIDIVKFIAQLIGQWEQSSEHRENVRIRYLADRSIPDVFADKNQLAQVLINLIKNSEEAMPGGGKITIEIKSDPGDNGIRINVTDNGPGITREQEKEIFKKFFTTKKGGLGVGLAVCDQIINAHNGSITIENRNTGGACVRIYLPFRPYKNIPVMDKHERVPGRETVK